MHVEASLPEKVCCTLRTIVSLQGLQELMPAAARGHYHQGCMLITSKLVTCTDMQHGRTRARQQSV